MSWGKKSDSLSPLQRFEGGVVFEMYIPVLSML